MLSSAFSPPRWPVLTPPELAHNTSVHTYSIAFEKISCRVVSFVCMDVSFGEPLILWCTNTYIKLIIFFIPMSVHTNAHTIRRGVLLHSHKQILAQLHWSNPCSKNSTREGGKKQKGLTDSTALNCKNRHTSLHTLCHKADWRKDQLCFCGLLLWNMSGSAANLRLKQCQSSVLSAQALVGLNTFKHFWVNLISFLMSFLWFLDSHLSARCLYLHTTNLSFHQLDTLSYTCFRNSHQPHPPYRKSRLCLLLVRPLSLFFFSIF